MAVTGHTSLVGCLLKELAHFYSFSSVGRLGSLLQCDKGEKIPSKIQWKLILDLLHPSWKISSFLL